MFSNIIGTFQRMLSKNKLIIKILIKLRNQANVIIGYSYALSHNHERNGEKWLIKKLKNQINSYIDVGANKGEWTDMLIDELSSENIARAFLIEPGEYAFGILTSKFGSKPNIQLSKLALSDKIGVSKFYEEPSGGETSSLSKAFSLESSKEIEVNVETIDSYFEQNKISTIDLLKIDCEGFDYYVLKGAVKCLENKKIKIIQFEYGDGWQLSGGTITSAAIYLSGFGYKLYAIKPDRLEEFEASKVGDFFRYSNFIASLNPII